MVRAVVVAGAVVALGAGLAAAGAAAGGVPSGAGAAPRTVAVAPGPADVPGDLPGGLPGDLPGGDRARPVLQAPLDPPVIVARPFDAPAEPWAPGHRGVDLATGPARPVRAPGAGLVTFSGTVVDRGVVTITHGDGLRSSLEPVVPAVRAGQRVLPGQVVGAVASTPGHCAPSTCLHWGLRRGETYLDPMRWVLDRGPVVLLPGE